MLTCSCEQPLEHLGRGAAAAPLERLLHQRGRLPLDRLEQRLHLLHAEQRARRACAAGRARCVAEQLAGGAQRSPRGLQRRPVSSARPRRSAARERVHAPARTRRPAAPTSTGAPAAYSLPGLSSPRPAGHLVDRQRVAVRPAAARPVRTRNARHPHAELEEEPVAHPVSSSSVTKRSPSSAASSVSSGDEVEQQRRHAHRGLGLLGGLRRGGRLRPRARLRALRRAWPPRAGAARGPTSPNSAASTMKVRCGMPGIAASARHSPATTAERLPLAEELRADVAARARPLRSRRPTRVTTRPAATAMHSEGICETSPSPIAMSA